MVNMSKNQVSSASIQQFMSIQPALSKSKPVRDDDFHKQGSKPVRDDDFHKQGIRNDEGVEPVPFMPRK